MEAVDKHGCSGTVVVMPSIQPLSPRQNAFTDDISFFEIQWHLMGVKIVSSGGYQCYYLNETKN